MKFSAVLAAVAIGAAPAVALPADILADTNGLETSSFAGLTDLQSKYARHIIAQAKKEDLGAHACQAGIATALVESTLIMHANYAVPGSLDYKHDRLGSDQDSVGLFQQRVSIYKDVECDMNAACSAHQFFAEMQEVPNWDKIDVGTLCQAVQRSDFPERYHQFIDQAVDICAEGGF